MYTITRKGIKREGFSVEHAPPPQSPLPVAEENAAAVNKIPCNVQQAFPFLCEGPIEADWFERASQYDREGEEAQPEVQMVVYHYCERQEDAKAIVSGGRLWGSLRHWTLNQLQASLQTDNPHYGDGVYFTYHHDLHLADERVCRAHGRNVAQRCYRVKIQVVRPRSVVKVRGTGGVGLIRPSSCQDIADSQRVVVGPDRLKPVKAEAWDEDRSQWRRI